MTLPFQRIIGVEYSAYLTRVAEHNIESARLFNRRCSSVNIICIDAVEYSFPETPLMVLFANPFTYEIMERVLGNIVASYRQNIRSIFLLFYGASSQMFPISQFLPMQSDEQSRWLVSDTLRHKKSINIFELPGQLGPPKA